MHVCRGPNATSKRTVWVCLLAILLAALLGLSPLIIPASAQQRAGTRQQGTDRANVPFYEGPQDSRIRAAVQKAVTYLRRRQAEVIRAQVGEASLVLQALAKAGLTYEGMVAPDDPYVAALIKKLEASCAGGTFRPGRQKFHGHDLYEAGCVVMAFAAYDVLARANHREQVRAVVNHILESVKPNGMWGYGGPSNEQQSDNSISQYALLGLWEATATYGIRVDPRVFERAAGWMIQTQHNSGGFVYHPQEGGMPTLSITAGAGGSVGICRDMVAYQRRRPTGRGMPLRPLEEVQQEEAEQEQRAAVGGFTPSLPRERFESSIERATAWLHANFRPDPPQWPMYYAYALERFATLNGDRWPRRGRFIPGNPPIDWYSVVAHHLIGVQRPDGSWPEHGTGASSEVGTAWGILFLVRSTLISKRTHANPLGGGSLLSGRGLPKNLNQLLVDKGELKPRPVGERGRLLAILEKLDVQNIDAALAAVEEEMTKEKPVVDDAVLERWRRLAERSPSPDVRAKAMAILGRSGNLDIVPTLLRGLADDNPAVVRAAREALQRISRKFYPIGPRSPTREEWEREVEAWYEWYRSIRPDWELEVADE